MSSHEIVCIAHLVAKEGMTENLLQVLLGLVNPSKNEPGCLSYQLHCNIENPNMFTFVDRFKDQAAFDYHCEAEYIKEAFDHLIPPLIESMEITLHREIQFSTRQDL